MNLSPRHLGRALAVLLACSALGGGACDRAVRQHPLTLEPQVFHFHKSIQDKRFSEAAGVMREDLRGPFLRSWSRAEKGADFPELEVVVQRVGADSEYTLIEAELHYILANDLVERKYRLVETWHGEGKTWVLANLVEAPPELRPAVETAPPPPASQEPAVTPSGDGFGGR